MAYRVIDKRRQYGHEEPKEVCRVCGSPEVHSREYGKPTMKCIEYLRSLIPKKEKKEQGD